MMLQGQQCTLSKKKEQLCFMNYQRLCSVIRTGFNQAILYGQTTTVIIVDTISWLISTTHPISEWTPVSSPTGERLRAYTILGSNVSRYTIVMHYSAWIWVSAARYGKQQRIMRLLDYQKLKYTPLIDNQNIHNKRREGFCPSLRMIGCVFNLAISRFWHFLSRHQRLTNLFCFKVEAMATYPEEWYAAS